MAPSIVETTRTLLRNGMLREAASAAMLARDTGDDAGAAAAREVMNALVRNAGELEQKGDLSGAGDALALGERLAPADASVCLRIGRLKQKAGDWEGALAPLDRAIAADGGAEAKLLRARSLYRLDRFADAETAFRAQLALQPGHPEVVITLARLAARRSDHAGVGKLLDDFLKAQPEHVEARVLRARAALAREDKAGAEADFREVARLRADHVEARVALGRFAVDENRHGDAVEHYSALARLQPDRPENRVRLARALGALGRRPEALAEWRAVLAVDPDRREARVNAARLLSRVERGQEAIDAWAGLAAAEPGNAEPPLQIARLLARLGRHGEAIAPLRRLAGIEPGHPEGQALLGAALNETGDHASAAPVWLALSAARPDDPAARQGLAIALDGAGDRAGALAAVRAGLALSPDDARLLTTQLRLAPKSEQAAAAARLREAEPDQGRLGRLALDEKIEPALIDPAWTSLEALGDALSDAGHATLAERAYRAALGTLDGADDRTRVTRKLAQSLVRLRRFDEANRLGVAFDAGDFASVETRVATLINSGDADGAYRICAEWFLNNKEHADGKRLLARVCTATKRYQNSVILYRSLVDGDAGARIEDWVGLLNSSFQAEDFDRALEVATAILGRDAANFDALRVRARVLQRRNAPEALEAWSVLATARPNDVEPLLQLARIHQASARSTLAAECWKALLKLKPDHIEALRALARAAQQSGEIDKAKIYWDQWIEAAPATIEPRLRLARALEKDGETRKAIEQYSAVTRIDEGHLEALTSIARLSRKL